MADIFVSYATEDRDRIRPLVERLEREGWSVWWDRALVAGPRFDEKIEQELDAARCVVVAWSHHSVNSRWCRSEATEGLERNILVPLCIDEVRPPLAFRSSHTASLIGWPEQEDDLAAVLSGVRACLGAMVVGVAPASSPPSQARHMPQGGEPLLAVLAFDNLSAEEELSYFSEGISEEILQTVSRTTHLKVIGRSSSLQFRGPEKSVPNVAAQLACTHVLDGSVRRSGNRVRISTQLIECQNQTTLWSTRFDSDLSDIFRLQDEIAAAVARVMDSQFTPSAQTGKIDSSAYDLYLRARTGSPGTAGIFNVGLLREVVARAPNFAQAWAVLAYSVSHEARYSRADQIPGLHALAREAAERALTLDPSSGLAHSALGYLCAPCGQYTEWLDANERAYRLSPRDPIVLYQCSLAHSWVGRIREALEFIESVAEIDPLYAVGANWHALMLESAGHVDEARAAFIAARQRWPDFEHLFVNASLFACRSGDFEWAQRMADEMARLRIDTPVTRRVQWTTRLLRIPVKDAREALQTDIDRQIEDTGSVTLSALALAAELGAVDAAYAAADRSSFAHLFRPGAHLPSREISVWALFRRDAAPLRRDSRFVDLCARLGYVKYWVESDRWPDCAGELPYDFRAEARRSATAPDGHRHR